MITVILLVIKHFFPIYFFFCLSKTKKFIWDKDRTHQVIRYHFWFTFARKSFRFIMKSYLEKITTEKIPRNLLIISLTDAQINFHLSLEKHELNHKKIFTPFFSNDIFGIFLFWRHMILFVKFYFHHYSWF